MTDRDADVDEAADEAARGSAGRGFGGDRDRGRGAADTDDDAGVDEHECLERRGSYGSRRGGKRHDRGGWSKADAGVQP